MYRHREKGRMVVSEWKILLREEKVKHEEGRSETGMWVEVGIHKALLTNRIRSVRGILKQVNTATSHLL